MDNDAVSLAELVLAARKARHAYLVEDDTDNQAIAGAWIAWMEAEKAAEDRAEKILAAASSAQAEKAREWNGIAQATGDGQ